MSNQSHYEINVAAAQRDEHGRVIMDWTGLKPRMEHLFATSERSCVTHSRMAHVLAEIRAKFPAPDYEVSVSYIDCAIRTVDVPSEVTARGE